VSKVDSRDEAQSYHHPYCGPCIVKLEKLSEEDNLLNFHIKDVSMWPFPPFPNPLDRPGQAPGPDRYTPGDDDEPAPY
jgi:hypothetical protein